MALFGEQGFAVSTAPKWHRSALRLHDDLAERQGRTRVAQPPTDICRFPLFVRAMNRWLPSRGRRLLWVDHWDVGVYDAETAIVEAARLGWGELRPLEDAPGFLFPDEDWLEEDQTEVAASMARALGLLVGLATIVMMSASDGWFIAEGSTDRIEFWEGNIFFYSVDRLQLQRAEQIMTDFACPRAVVAEPRVVPPAVPRSLDS